MIAGCWILNAAFRPERVESAKRVQARIESAGITCGIHEDFAAEGALSPMLDMIESVSMAYAPDELIAFAQDDCLFSSNLELGLQKAEVLIREGKADVVDLHSKCFKAPKPHWYRTPDGFTGLLAVAKAHVWKEYIQWCKATGLVTDGDRFESKFKADELMNIFGQCTGKKIVFPGRSFADHDASLESLDGNQQQTEDGLVIRSGPQFVPDTPTEVSNEVADTLRIFAGNHWRFYWTMTPSQRTATGYIQQAYKVGRTPHELS